MTLKIIQTIFLNNISMRAKGLIIILIIIGLFLIPPSAVAAQDDEFSIHVRRDFGYGMGNTIQGRFTVRLVGEAALVDSVSFLIDEDIFATVDSAPFKYQFSTEDFEPGYHQLAAKVHFVDGSVETTPAAQFSFLSSTEANRQIRDLLLVLGGVVIGAVLITVFVQSLLTKKTSNHTPSTGKPRSYGMLGGTICPKCGKPFPRHIWGMNLVVGRLDRCEHCGKWVMTVRATPAALSAAEKLEDIAESEPEGDILSHQPDAVDEIDDTKYFDEI